MVMENPLMPQPTALADLTVQKPLLSNTQQATNILGAKTGKAAPLGLGAGPKQSNLAEKAAVQETQSQLNQQAQQRSQNTQDALYQQQTIQEQTKQQEEQLNQEELDNQSRYLQRSQEILNEWKRQGQSLDFSKKAAQTEQLGFTLRLSNTKYINDLKRNGQKSRLQNKLKFNEELQRSIWSEEADLFNDNLTFRKMINQDERAFKQEMTERGMDVSMAMQIANAKAESIQQTWTGVGQLAQTGVSAYGQYESNQKAEKEKYLKYQDKETSAGRPPLSFDQWSKKQQDKMDALD